MKITFLGAAHEVTGCCTLIETNGKNILVDCGMEQGADIFENQEIPFDPKTIRNHAETFSEERFKKEIKEFVELKYNEFNHLVK